MAARKQSEKGDVAKNSLVDKVTDGYSKPPPPRHDQIPLEICAALGGHLRSKL